MLNVFKHLQRVTVRHPREIIADGAFGAVFGDARGVLRTEVLLVAEVEGKELFQNAAGAPVDAVNGGVPVEARDEEIRQGGQLRARFRGETVLERRQRREVRRRLDSLRRIRLFFRFFLFDR